MCDVGFPVKTANSIHIMKMCRAMARNGHDVTLLGRPGDPVLGDVHDFYGVERCFDFQPCRYPSRIPAASYVSIADAVRRVLTRIRPDLVYSRSPRCAAVMAGLGVPTAFEDHETPERGRFTRWVIGRVLRARSTRRLVVITHALAKEYRRVFPWFPSDKVIVAPDGADLPGEVPSLRDDATWPGRSGHLQVGYVGQLYAGRGIDLVVALAQRLGAVDFHVVGGEAPDVKSWRAEAGQLDNLHFHGFVTPGLVDAYRASVDILLAPYQRDTSYPVSPGVSRNTARWMSPMKVFEYMAAAKPIVCSDLPVLREVLEHETNALLAPPHDVRSWADAVERLERDAELRDRLGCRAREDVAANYTWAVRARNVVADIRV
jgi:glycosyltransferase involved in cell wall biosynthesis